MKLFQDYYSAQEIADAGSRLRLKVVPHSKFRVLEMASRENWNASPLCRKRTGVEGGGGNEYHLSLLPLSLQTALMAEQANKNRLMEIAQTQDSNIEVRDTLEISDLSARQKEIMDARAGILHAISLRMYENGMSHRGAIMAFLEDVKGGHLPKVLMAYVARANDKGRGLSRNTITRWFNMQETGGIVALAPKKTRDVEAVPAWMKAFLSYYRQNHRRVKLAFGKMACGLCLMIIVVKRGLKKMVQLLLLILLATLLTITF